MLQVKVARGALFQVSWWGLRLPTHPASMVKQEVFFSGYIELLVGYTASSLIYTSGETFGEGELLKKQSHIQ